jgi:hypothetical protein
VRQFYNAVFSYHECPSELEYIASRRSKIAAKRGPCRLQHDLQSHDLSNAAALEAVSSIRLAVGVGDAVEGGAMRFAQLPCAMRRALGNSRNSNVSFFEFGIRIAQRAKLLVAEGSAEVPQED